MGSSTIGLTAGKWYAECKIVVIDSATVGISPDVAVHAKDNTYNWLTRTRLVYFT